MHVIPTNVYVNIAKINKEAMIGGFAKNFHHLVSVVNGCLKSFEVKKKHVQDVARAIFSHLLHEGLCEGGDGVKRVSAHPC